jgi:hypothetical protein
LPTVLHRNLPLLEVAEPRLLDELLLDRQVAGMVLTRLSDRVALVDPGQYAALIARLRKIGHLPKAEA